MILPQDLRERLVVRDPDALGLLFDLYFERVWAFMRRSVDDVATAEDLTQEVFLGVHRSVERLDPRRELAPWIFSIAANKLRDHWRRTGRSRVATSLDDDENPVVAVAPQEDLNPEDYSGALQRAVSILPADAREIVELRVFQELSYEQIGECLDLSPQAARKRFSRAIQALRENLGQSCESLLGQ